MEVEKGMYCRATSGQARLHTERQHAWQKTHARSPLPRPNKRPFRLENRTVTVDSC